MSERATLVRYLRALLAEEGNARVPNQLISPDASDGEDVKEEEAELDEFCGAGGGNVMGYSAPLGADSKKSKRVRK